MMLRHIFGAWALTASAHVEAICLDGEATLSVAGSRGRNKDRRHNSGSMGSHRSSAPSQKGAHQLNTIEIGRRLALQVVKTMEIFQGFVGAPLDQAGYRAVLVACNAAKLPFDEGARLVEVALQYYCSMGGNETDGGGGGGGGAVAAGVDDQQQADYTNNNSRDSARRTGRYRSRGVTDVAAAAAEA